MRDSLPRVMAPQDPPKHSSLPTYWRSRLSDIEAELDEVSRGQVSTLATSPGGLPVHVVTYGDKEDFHSRANYNSATGAGNPAFYALKTPDTKPVVLILGPVHGQELENIVGTVNLIHVLETGKDRRGQDWSQLRSRVERCRVVIIPCGNPDGRRRCPYDSFVGLPELVMFKHGQGTRRDGTMWGYPHCMANHPMRGDVGILGCYYNDDGINIAHDDFFGDMAAETRAILDTARAEAPDLVVSLHSNPDPPFINQTGSVPLLMQRRTQELSERVKGRFAREGLPNGPIHELRRDDGQGVPTKYFNLNSAIHHVCGTTCFTFECIHGLVREGEAEPAATHEQILDIQLSLYDEMLSYVLENRLYWEV